MGGVAIGPFILSGGRSAAIVGAALFLLVGWIFELKAKWPITNWMQSLLLAAFVGARAGHVLLFWSSFLGSPWRILAIWQGGFSWKFGAMSALAVAAPALWRKPHLRVPTALALSVSLLGWGLSFQYFVKNDAAVAAPTHELSLLDGGAIDLSQLHGRPMVLNLWASWCPPCRRELPMMARFAATEGKVDFVFANQGENPAVIQRFLTAQRLSIRTVAIDQQSSLMRHYQALGLPATLFIAADGQVVAAQLGEISSETLQVETDTLNSGAH